MVLSTVAIEDWEIRHVDFEKAYLQAPIDQEIFVEIPEEYQEIPGAVGKLNKAMNGLTQAGRCWNMTITEDLKTLGFEHL